MIRIFLDANVVIDYLDTSSSDHIIARRCLQIVRAYFGKPVVSPFTFLITNFLLGKFVKDKEKHKRQMQTVFSSMEITEVSSAVVKAVLSGDFIDLEDGLQYECALSAKANVILTKNMHDFIPSKIPIFHPNNFVYMYNELFSK